MGVFKVVLVILIAKVFSSEVSAEEETYEDFKELRTVLTRGFISEIENIQKKHAESKTLTEPYYFVWRKSKATLNLSTVSKKGSEYKSYLSQYCEKIDDSDEEHQFASVERLARLKKLALLYCKNAISISEQLERENHASMMHVLTRTVGFF